MDLIILTGALIITYLVFTGLIKIIKTSLTTAISIALLVLLLQLIFGIQPEQLWQQLKELPDTLRSLINLP
jgi:hypothetical protein